MIELKDANTRAVFGDYIAISDIKQAVDDHALVRRECHPGLAELVAPIRMQQD